MKTLKTSLWLLTLLWLLAVTMFVVACDSEDDQALRNDEPQDAAYAEEQMRAEQVFADLEQIADEAEDPESVHFKTGSSRCATVSRDTTVVPARIVVDFGPVNCLGPDSNYRRGQIIITYTGRPHRQGWSRNISTQNYYFNDFEVRATQTITRLANNQRGNPQSTCQGQGIVVSPSQQDSLYWNSNRRREWVQGRNTPRVVDDVFLLTGSNTLRSTFRGSRNVQIIQPLRRERSCRWFVSGSVQISPAKAPQRTLDYGNGRCNPWATLTVNGNTRRIRL